MGDQGKSSMIRVEVINTFLLNDGKEFVILLHGSEGNEQRTLPISIGQLEAQSIALQLNHIPFPRPLTHDLLKTLIEKLEGTVIKSEIYQLKDDTFFATIHFKIADQLLSIDARPSDAIALALRFSAPVYVAESVMSEAGVIIPESTVEKPLAAGPVTEDGEKSTEPSTIDLLKQQLDNAIANERYEDAARIRDDINKQTKTN